MSIANLPNSDRANESRKTIIESLRDRLAQIEFERFTGVLIVVSHWPSKHISITDDTVTPSLLHIDAQSDRKAKTLAAAVELLVQRICREFEFTVNFVGKITLHVAISRGDVVNYACTSEKSYKVA